jgi:hypothetical protein
MVAAREKRLDRIATVRQAPQIRRRLAGLALAMGLVAGVAQADGRGRGEDDDRGKFCSATAKAAFRACGNEAQDDDWTAVAICTNVSDEEQRQECLADARAERREAERLCGDQLAARRRLCATLGEERYDPDFDPASFEDDFKSLGNPNPYFPLSIGNRWDYAGSETVTVEVLDRTKKIEGVPCIVVRDRVLQDGRLVEDTEDWFAQALDGNVWYCGEQVRDFESFEGDDPEEPELVSIDGSFKAGRDGDKPGILFRALPAAGETYRQEFSLGNAEDVAHVLSAAYAFGEDAELDEHVPSALAQLLCSGDCVVTAEGTPLEPDVLERKYYAPGIGLFLSINPETGERVQLVDCNFDPRCPALPVP